MAHRRAMITLILFFDYLSRALQLEERARSLIMRCCGMSYCSATQDKMANSADQQRSHVTWLWSKQHYAVLAVLELDLLVKYFDRCC
jgi:hypothetical protein